MTDANIIFEDVVFINSTSASPISAETVQTLSSAVLSKPEDYEIQVQRMSASLREVPLFMAQIPNPALPLQTNMSITLNYAGNFFQQFISVTPQEAKQGVFSYQNYLNDLNAASTAAFTALKAAFPAAPPTAPPLFYIDPATALISMYVQDLYLDNLPNTILIGFNQVLQQIMDLAFSQAFPIPAPFGYEFQIAVNNSAVLLPAAPRTGVPLAISAIAGNLLQVSQEFVSTDEWDNVKSVILLSNLIPVNREIIPINSSPNQSFSILSSYMGILIDFELVKSNPFEPRHEAQYICQSEFVMKSMSGTTPLNQVDIKVFYQTYSGEIIPLSVGYNTGFTAKLMFRRKFKE